MRFAAIALLTLVLQGTPPQVRQIQEWFEAGRYQRIVDAASQASDPQAKYLVASSYDRLGQVEDARRLFSELSARGDSDPWGWIGRSAHALVSPGSAAPGSGALGEARMAAMQAVGNLTSTTQGGVATTAGAGSGLALAYASYQLGQVLTFQQEYGPAAESFDRAAELNPSFAYAYYYAGMSYREVSRIDLMALRFERFLELAPEAPERTRIQALMRTVRGR